MKTKKVIVISGASSGIGKAIAEHLSAQGHAVYGTSRNPSQSTQAQQFQLLSLDVTSDQSTAELVQTVLKKEGRIDVLINNAGKGMTGPVEETPLSEVQSLFDLNYFGALRMIQAVLPTMRSQRSGLIVNVSSIAGYMGLPYRAHYSAVKSALSMLTEGLRLELKSFEVDVVNLAPGDFATNIASGRYHAPLKENSPYYTTYKDQLEQF
ncbi:MAG: SDR family oxidoreductase, partial [Flavobacteriaceae bacterium]